MPQPPMRREGYNKIIIAHFAVTWAYRTLGDVIKNEHQYKQEMSMPPDRRRKLRRLQRAKAAQHLPSSLRME